MTTTCKSAIVFRLRLEKEIAARSIIVPPGWDASPSRADHHLPTQSCLLYFVGLALVAYSWMKRDTVKLKPFGQEKVESGMIPGRLLR